MKVEFQLLISEFQRKSLVKEKKESLKTLQAWPLSNSKNNFPGVLPIKIIKEESCYLQNSNWSGMITFAAMQKNNDAMQGRLHSNNCPQQQQHRCLILNGNSKFWQIVFKSNLCHFNWLPLLLLFYREFFRSSGAG